MYIYIYTHTYIYMYIYIYICIYSIYIYIYTPLKTSDIFRGYKMGTLRINGLKAFAHDMINLFYYEHWTGKRKKDYLNFVFSRNFV